MADSVVRLTVNSSEYDQKLKRAAEGLTRYADECRKVGGTLEVVEKDTLDYVRALGQMDTTSRTATGKLAEMKKTFTELSVVYKNMTDEEKNSPFGKALATSLDQLKGRIQDSKSQLDDINKSVNGGGGLTGALDSLSDKFGMSVKSLAGWGTALAAGKAALDVAKDAFFASEATVDEWGRVMDSSKSLYEGFLTALNTGDISGYLSRIDSIVQAARAAYNELDRLGTMKTIQAPQMSAQQTENERMRMMIQTGRYIAPIDGRKASMQNGQLLTPDQITRIEKQLQNGMQKVVSLVGNEVKQTGRAIDAVYNRQAQELGMSLKEFRKGTSSMAEFDKRMAGYEKYKEFESAHTVTSTFQSSAGVMLQSRRDNVANPYAEFAKWGTFRVDGDRYNDLVKLIQQRDQQAGQAYSMQSQAYRTMNRAEGVTLRQIMGGGAGGSRGRGGVGGGSGTATDNTPTYAADSIAAQEVEVRRLTDLWRNADATMRDGYLKDLDAAKNKLAGMKLVKPTGADTSGMTGTGFVDYSFGEVGKGLDPDNMAKVITQAQLLAEQAEKNKKAWGDATQAIGMVGTALSSIENPAAKVAGTIALAIANVASAAAQAMSAKDTTSSGWAWIGAAAAIAAEMVTIISTISNASRYAEGGIVKGNSYSGDNMMFGGDGLYGLNAGELVLTKAQQGNLANALEGGGLGNLNLTGVVEGENIRIALDRNLRRQGKELVVWGG